MWHTVRTTILPKTNGHVDLTTNGSRAKLNIQVESPANASINIYNENTPSHAVLEKQRVMSTRTNLNSTDLTGILTFYNVSYAIETRKRIPFKCTSCRRLNDQNSKRIIKNISGQFQNGMNAILGPTGCGKSSLLDILADRKDQSGISGHIMIDGNLRSPSYKYTVGYVVQDDMFSDTLTVRENLLFSANLRLPKTLNASEKLKRVSSIISELGLESCADTRMGDALSRGVSGGERKRTSIGMELILSPKILFLDEPTTGLDASTARNLMECLRNLSNQQRTIIFSIHQPSYSIFKLFDQLMLMCKGECVFHGPAQDVLPFFSSQGYQCEQHDNPTDFAVNVLFDANKRPEILAKLSFAYVQSHWCKEAIALDVKQRMQKTSKAPSQDRVLQPLGTEFVYVSHRTLIKFIRNWALIVSQVLVSIILGLLVGVVFYDMKATVSPGIPNRFNLINFIVLGQLFSTLATLEPLIQERRLFIHVSEQLHTKLTQNCFFQEYQSGYYRISTFFVAKVLFDLLLMRIVPAICFSVIAYFMTGLQRVASKFFIFMLTVFMATVFGSATCFFVSATISVFGIALIFIALIFTTMMMFTGYLADLKSMFSWLSWMQWISAFRYASNVVLINEFQGQTFCIANQTSVCPVTGEDVLREQSLDYTSAWDLWKYFLALTIMALVFLVLAFIQLVRVKKSK